MQNEKHTIELANYWGITTPEMSKKINIPSEETSFLYATNKKTKEVCVFSSPFDDFEHRRYEFEEETINAIHALHLITKIAEATGSTHDEVYNSFGGNADKLANIYFGVD